MSWTNFLIVIFIVYLVYYSLNLFFDLFLSPRTPQGEIAEDELFFTQTFTPELITPDEKIEEVTSVDEAYKKEKPITSISTGTVASSGGISLKHLFALAKDNLIEHTRAIPY
ncbi:hypothetical protein GJU39_01360 [Pedobacter petrophilus]|uniref:Uncharacterized protein n=1 Tax=Pedobacter petrophilus TaxID=1908241 RepID=A0A7K0FTR7_9SPHI|nr:hypothetical protein [Pedobacter petrophilus]MRX74722.1 hypothetical protein [Pedobacter petrophilus]